MSAAQLPLVARARSWAERPALVAADGAWTYGELLAASARVAAALLADRGDLAEERVAFHVAPGLAHVAVQWGIWRAGGIAVPLCPAHPPAELAHVLADSDPALVVGDAAGGAALAELVADRGLPLLATDTLLRSEVVPVALPAVGDERRAMLLYTSGTTSRPKGVVWTHAMLAFQCETLCQAWGWQATDHALHLLPLHHVHGIVNVLSCALWSGACCELASRFVAETVWERLASGEITVLMAVPTLYFRLLQAWEGAPAATREGWSRGAARLRLMVSGSAALPAPVFLRWQEITGHALLERYGMTEIGMALSNPYHGERRPGHVGQPLPGVEVRLVGPDGTPVAAAEVGEIEVAGPGVFQEYWRRPDDTTAAFRDGWFRTGDTAVVADGSYRLLGRSSVDIIKSGGYKISALEIEAVLLGHPAVRECAVVGVEDAEWGERVAAAVVLRGDQPLELEPLRAWARDRLAPYKLPTRLLTVAELPKNAMGKVVKSAVRALWAL